MTTEELRTRLESIEWQVSQLRAELDKLSDEARPRSQFRDLYGSCPELGDLTLEEIKAAEYTIDLDEWPEQAGPLSVAS